MHRLGRGLVHAPLQRYERLFSPRAGLRRSGSVKRHLCRADLRRSTCRARCREGRLPREEGQADTDHRFSSRRRASEIRKYVETLAFSMDDASKHSMVNFPLPMIILRVDSGEIIWANDGFTQISGKHETLFESHITDVLHGFDTRWIMEGKTLCPYDVEMGGRKYQVYGNMVRSGRSQGTALLATLFWVDVTEYCRLRDHVERSRPVVGILVIDSYEELVKGASEAEKSTMTAEIDRRINEWAKPSGGIIRRLERDRYLLVTDQAALVTFTADKFSILESIQTGKPLHDLIRAAREAGSDDDCSIMVVNYNE